MADNDTTTKNSGLNDIFANTLAPNPVTSYTLFRGVTDYTNLAQFDLYESGYSFLILLQMPYFMDKLADKSESYKTLIDNYRHIIEYEFRGAQGIEDITAETSPLQNGITDLNIITKVTEQGGTSFSMNYFERSGSVITKTHELFLRGIKDPKTQVKRYNGLLKAPLTTRNAALAEANETSETNNTNLMHDKGYQYEIYHFLLIVTDNTALNVEKAYVLASCQPALANTSIYNVTRGEIQFQEMAVQFNGLPLPGRVVNAKAQEFLNYINNYTCFDEMDFGYSVLDKLNAGVNNNTLPNAAQAFSPENVEEQNKLAKSKVWNGTEFVDKEPSSTSTGTVTNYTSV